MKLWREFLYELQPDETHSFDAGVAPENWSIVPLDLYSGAITVTHSASALVGLPLVPGDTLTMPGLNSNTITVRSNVLALETVRIYAVAYSEYTFSLTKAALPEGSLVYKQGASVRRTTNQSTTDPNTKIVWDTVDWDTDTCWNTVYPTRLTVKTPGKYLITTWLEFYHTAISSIVSKIWINNVIVAQAANYYQNSVYPFAIVTSFIGNLVENDFIEISGGGNTSGILVKAVYQTPRFTIARIGS